MPFMDGLELTELVRKDFPDMKILFSLNGLSSVDEKLVKGLLRSSSVGTLDKLHIRTYSFKREKSITLHNKLLLVYDTLNFDAVFLCYSS